MKQVSLFFYDITNLKINDLDLEELSRFIDNLKSLTKIHSTEKLILSLICDDKDISKITYISNLIKNLIDDETIIIKRNFFNNGYLEEDRTYYTTSDNLTELIMFTSNQEKLYMLSGIYYASCSLDKHDTIHFKSKYYIKDDGISSIILESNDNLTELNNYLEESIINPLLKSSLTHTHKPNKK